MQRTSEMDIQKQLYFLPHPFFTSQKQNIFLKSSVAFIFVPHWYVSQQVLKTF